MRWTIFRPSWIFGPGDGLSEQINDLLEASVVPLIDGGKYRIQPVSVDDVVSCMTRSLSMPETQGESYDVGGPDRLQFVEVVHKFAEIAGKKVRTMNVPSWSIKPVVALMQRFAFFPLTIDQLRMLSEDNVCEIDHFVKTFHIEPKSFNDEVKTLVRHVARAA
jgi:NADH dehydrogenase